MELQAINLRPLVESQSELAPYLAGLNVSEALADFGRLADLVLSSEQPADQSQHQHYHHTNQQLGPQVHQQPMMVATTGGCGNSFLPYSCLHDSSSPSSPGGASLYSTNTTCSSQGSLHWSRVSSPMTSDHSFANYSPSSSAFSSPSHDDQHQYSSCSSSSSGSSSGGSVCGDLDEHQSSSSSRSSCSRKSTKSGDRRRQNATAAERYRKRVRGRRGTLDQELERERARNSKLMRNFEAKLELYREFADLLASNTRDPSNDLNLAKIGSRSLENILEHICPARFLAQNERQRQELERLLEHFRRVLSVGPYLQRA